MPSTCRGAARTVDMFGKLDEYKLSPSADLELIARDWKIIGNDIRMSINEFENQEKTEE